VKLVHPVGFITKKFLTMHGHMNVKFSISVMPHQTLMWKQSSRTTTWNICP